MEGIYIYVLAGFPKPVRRLQRGLTIFLHLLFNQHRVVSLQIKTDFYIILRVGFPGKKPGSRLIYRETGEGNGADNLNQDD